MAEPYSGPKLKDLRGNLGKLVTEGLLPYHVAEVGGKLLELKLVTSRLNLPDNPTEEEEETAYAEALTEVLNEAVAMKNSGIRRKDRKVLKNVLPLRKNLLGEPIEKRRAAAGKDMKDGKKGVKPGTVRTYYEPRALDRLAQVLVNMEAEYRGEQSAEDADST